MLSVVIPALNAGGSIGACIQAVKGAGEIIVVDGGSADATIAIAEREGARVVRSERGRGIQLAAGAEVARGEWLLFLHADTLLAPGWNDAVALHRAPHPDKAGCFRFRLDDAVWQARLIERGVELRTRLLGLPYGDQGLLISRQLYERVGGYRPLPLMEDVDLVRRLGRVRVLDADAVTSAERWRRDGWFARSARNIMILMLYRGGVSPAKLRQFYSRSS